MFFTDTIIDAVQNGKKYFVSNFVTDKEVQKPLNDYIDVQTSFVKQIVKTNQELANQFTNSFTKISKTAKA